jgi:hypothetical protein
MESAGTTNDADCYKVGDPKLSAIKMMASAANGAKLISNSVAPSPMVMYFIVILLYSLSAPVAGASRFIVIEATL